MGLPALKRSFRPSRGLISLVLFFIVGSALIVVVARAVERADAHHELSESRHKLASIADLKVTQLVNWRAERLLDGRMITFNPMIAERVASLRLDPTNAGARDELLAWMTNYVTEQTYSAVTVFDAAGEPLLRVGNSGYAQDTAEIVDAAHAGAPQLTDLRRSERDGAISLTVLAPHVLPGLVSGAPPRVVGVTALSIDPTRFLYPYIQTWPTPSPSGETLLARAEGEDVLFLNERRFGRGAALTERARLSSPRLPMALALRGARGAVTGVDYRGTLVLAHMSGIPGTSWCMVTKLDLAEVGAKAGERARFIEVIAGALIVLLALLCLYSWKRRESRFLLRALAAEEARSSLSEALRENEEILRSMMGAITEQVVVLTNDGIVRAINPVGARRLGVLAEDAVGRRLYELLPPELASSRQAQVEAVVRTGVHHRFEDERDDRHVLTSTYPMFDAQGVVRGVVVSCVDVTELRQAREQSRQSEERIRLVLDSVAEGIFGVDLDGNCTFANPACARLLGYETCDELLRENIHDKLHHSRAEGSPLSKEDCQICQAFKAGKSSHVDDEVLWRADGSSFPAEYWSHPQRREGEVVGGVVTFVDTSERLEAAEALRASEERFRVLFHGSADPVFFHGVGADGESGRFEIVSDAACRLLGYTHDELTQMLPEDLDASTPVFNDTDPGRARVVNGVMSFEVEHRAKDGRTIPVEVRAQVLDLDGRKVAISTARDLTKRKRAEALHFARGRMLEKLSTATVLEQAFDGLLEFASAVFPDHPASVLVLDPSARRLHLGASRGLPAFYNEAIEGMEIGPREGSCGAAAFLGRRYVAEDIEADENWAPFVTLARRAGLAACWSEPMCSASGRVLGTFAVYCRRPHTPDTDDLRLLADAARIGGIVMERKQAELASQEAKEFAEAANRSKSEFLSRMSHELRTPLNAILGFAQLLELGATTPHQQEQIEHILIGGRHLLDLINEILDLALIESGRLAISTEPVDLSALVANVLGLTSPLAAAVGVTLTSDQACGEGLYVRADEQRLKQVLLNLVSNAIKYNRKDGAVGLHWERKDERVVIRVTDTGPGLTPEQQARLFQPFERLDAENSDIEGTGLGLTVCRSLVGTMGGSVGVESSVGEGSSFWVDLPCAEGPEDRARPEFPVALPVAEGGNGRSVLYIEDNPSNMLLVEQALAHRPEVTFLSATNGAAGFKVAHEQRPDLVLLDMQLPDIGGLDVLKALKDDPATQDIPVVMVSADATSGPRETLLAAGAAEYLTKPLEIRSFLAVVTSILGQKEASVCAPC